MNSTDKRLRDDVHMAANTIERESPGTAECLVFFFVRCL